MATGLTVCRGNPHSLFTQSFIHMGIKAAVSVAGYSSVPGGRFGTLGMTQRCPFPCAGERCPLEERERERVHFKDTALPLRGLSTE